MLPTKFLLCALALTCGLVASDSSQSNSTNVTVSPLLNQPISLLSTADILAHTCTNQDGVVTSAITTVGGVALSWMIEGTQLFLNASFNTSASETVAVGVASGNSRDLLRLVVGDVINDTVAEYSVENGTPSPVQNGTLPTTLVFASTKEDNTTADLLTRAQFLPVNLDKCALYRAPIKLTGVPGEPKVLNHVCSVENGNHVSKVSTEAGTWTWHVSNGTLYMNVTHNGVFGGWYGAGFTDGPDRMFPATAIIGNLSTGTVEEYALNMTAPKMVSKKDNQSLLISGKVFVTDNTTSISFVRKLDPNSGDFFNATGLVYPIWAGSYISALGPHAPKTGRGGFTTHMNLCGLTRPEVNLTRIPGAPKVLHHTCAKKNGVVSSKIELAKGVTLNWTIVDDVLNITATLNRSAVGWFGVGFTNSSAQMVPSNVFIGNLSTGTVGEYSLPNFQEMTMKTNNTLLQSGSAALLSNTTVLSFSRRLDANAANDYLVTKGTAYIIFAVGQNANLMAGHTPGLGRGDIMTELDICATVL